MAKRDKKIRKKEKTQKPLNKQKWNKGFNFYHNKSSQLFLLTIANRGDYVAGHDMTTHPSLNKDKKPKKKYMLLHKNPNSKDQSNSYVNKKLRIPIKRHYEDTGNERLTPKKKWKVCKQDKKALGKLDRGKI